LGAEISNNTALYFRVPLSLCPMKRLLLFYKFLVFGLIACTDEPVKGKPNGGDSLTDTSGNALVVHSDTSKEARKQNDCSILRRKVVDDPTGKRLLSDLRLMTACGLDSFDFIYVVPNLGLDYITHEQMSGNDSLTYGDVLKHINEFKTTGTYTQLKNQVMTLDSLKTIQFKPREMERMKPVMGRLGFTEPEWLSFTKFASTYPLPKDRPMSWGEMLEAFDGYLAKDSK
jgi:hypothetical protein